MNTFATFSLSKFFKDLTDEEYQIAHDAVMVRFWGVSAMWSPEVCTIPDYVRDAKRDMCYDYLIAWQLLTLYPTKGVNVNSMGGMPLSAKAIGDISLKYADTTRQGADSLNMLTTNAFGLQALEMIQSAPDNYVLYR